MGGRVARATRMLVTASLLLTLAGCSAPTGDDHAAASVAEQFSSAMSAGDLDTACSLLARGTLAELEDDSGSPCVEALGALALPAGGEEEVTHAYARAAESWATHPL